MVRLSNLTEQPPAQSRKVDMTLLRFIVLTAQARRFVKIFQRDEETPHGSRPLQEDEDIAIETTVKYYKLGFKSRYHLGSFVFWALMVGCEFSESNQTIQTALENTLEDTDKRFITISREMKRVFGNKIRNYHG